jgi:tryptophanyl-tRNA synthetase
VIPHPFADEYEQYGPLKTDTAAAVIELLEPVQARYRELEADPAETARLLKLGADKARDDRGGHDGTGPHQRRAAHRLSRPTGAQSSSTSNSTRPIAGSIVHASAGV